MNADQIREELLIATDEQAVALERYLEEEETRRKAEELLDSRLREKADRGMNFAI